MKASAACRYAAIALFAVVAAGCSDKSRLSLTVLSFTGSSDGNQGNTTIYADLVGSFSHPCTLIAADTATAVLQVSRPGTIGPSFGVYMNSFSVDYYYFDPADGQLKGPVSALSYTAPTGNQFISAGGTGSITVPLVPTRVKAWTVGVYSNGVAGWSGLGTITRMIAKVTFSGQDETGKSISATAQMLIYLADYAPVPTPPASGSTPTPDNFCSGMSAATYLQGQ